MGILLIETIARWGKEYYLYDCIYLSGHTLIFIFFFLPTISWESINPKKSFLEKTFVWSFGQEERNPDEYKYTLLLAVTGERNQT